MLKMKYFPISSYSKFVFCPQIRELSRNKLINLKGQIFVYSFSNLTKVCHCVNSGINWEYIFADTSCPSVPP